MIRLSLRARVLTLIALLNAAFFVAGGLYVRARLVKANDELIEYLVVDVLGSGLRSNIDNAGDFKVGPILRYDSWDILQDAILVGSRNLERRGDRVVAGGIDLNPLGCVDRPPGFDRQAILRALLRAIETGTTVSVAGGRAIPILTDGRVWGGCWFQLEPPVDFLGLFRSLLPLFLASTLLLTAGSFWLLREMVLEPVEQLAEGARRVRGGDFSVRVPEPVRHDELADLVRSFNEMTSTVRSFNERLAEEVRVATEQARRAESAAMTQRRLAAMGELAAGIAHEINNPLGGMQNAVDVLSRADLDQDRRERYAALVARGLQRIGETVSRLRRFTPRDAPLEPLDLVAVAKDALDLVRHRAERSGIELVRRLEPGPLPPVVGARNEVGQAVLNLLGNALDALEEAGTSDPRGPRVEVSVAPSAGGVAVVVEDDGPGVDADELERLADLYYTTKEVGKGTGLGLALAHDTMRRHGGRVTLASRRGHGLRAELWFPARDGSLPREERPDA